MQALLALPTATQDALKKLAQDEYDSRMNANWVGLHTGDFSDEVARELVSKGLAENAMDPDEEDPTPILRLTDAGRELGRFHTAKGDVPEWTL